MGTLYERIQALCKQKGVSGSRMCLDLGLSKSTLSDLKNGRTKGFSVPTAQKIAGYFNVTVDELYGGSAEKAPTANGERSVSDDELKFALWGSDDIDDEDLEDVRQYAAFVKERKKAKK